MKTAEEIYEEIGNMESTERWKIVKMINEFSYSPNKGKAELNALIEEMGQLKKDIEFLSRKMGLHDMYINRMIK